VPSRRAAIRLSDAEVREFLEKGRTIVICSNGQGGVPHPMPMWYGLDPDGSVVMTTFARSQKVRNLERDPRVALLLEDGESYGELRGVVVYGRAEIERDVERVLETLARVSARTQAGAGADPKALRAALRGQAAKRVALRVRPERVVSWDHRKLGGVY
jgi:PPOX class probable F420-dependent enzyme